MLYSKSELNIQSLLEDTLATLKPDIITVENLANEISNLDDAKSEEEMLLEMKDKVKFLMKLLKKVKENQPKIKIVVLKPLDRNDGKTKQKISKMVGEGEVKGSKGKPLLEKTSLTFAFILLFACVLRFYVFS